MVVQLLLRNSDRGSGIYSWIVGFFDMASKMYIYLSDPLAILLLMSSKIEFQRCFSAPVILYLMNECFLYEVYFKD